MVFTSDSATRRDRIEQALAELGKATGEDALRVLETLSFEAHGLRGAAATVELSGIAALAADLERAVANWNPGAPSTQDAVAGATLRLLGALQTFSAEAPRGRAPVVESAPAPEEGPIVLHIEDNASNLKLVERILERRPEIRLVEAHTGAEGLALAAELAPTLVLLDLRLPDLSGEEVLTELRADDATRAIPVVFVSAEARQTEMDRLLAAGANEFLVKPFDVGTFLDLVDRLLARARS